MKKNLTVGMPLAVPTQKRPPSKYASHPYPVLEIGYVCINSQVKGVGRLLNMPLDKTQLYSQLRGKGGLNSIYIKYEHNPDLTLVSSVIKGNGSLKSVYTSYYPEPEFIEAKSIVKGVGILRVVVIKNNANDTVNLTVQIRGIGELK